MKKVAILLFIFWGLQAYAEPKIIEFSDFKNDVMSFANSLGDNGFAHHPFDFTRCSFQVSSEEGSFTASLKTQKGIKQINILDVTTIYRDEFKSEYDGFWYKSFFKENEEKPFLRIETQPRSFQRAKINVDGEIEFTAWMECNWDLHTN